MGELTSGQQTTKLSDLPDSVLLEIWIYLSAHDLNCLACTCSRFNRIVKDEILWRHVFRQRFKIPKSVPRRPGSSSWRSEYQRLWEASPAVLCEELTAHRDQVLHVSFSHNGRLFSTCSKDGKVMVWTASTPSTMKFSANMMELFHWRYTQFSQFNKTDTLLLVSGVFHGNLTTSGEIAVFELEEFEVQCRVVNKPYDVFGCWYNNHHLFSGTLYWTGHLQSISALWLNKASQETESEKESVMMNLYRFSNVNASSLRTVMVADVPVLDTTIITSSDISAQDTSPDITSSDAISSDNISPDTDTSFSDVEMLNINNNFSDACSPLYGEDFDVDFMEGVESVSDLLSPEHANPGCSPFKNASDSSDEALMNDKAATCSNTTYRCDHEDGCVSVSNHSYSGQDSSSTSNVTEPSSPSSATGSSFACCFPATEKSASLSQAKSDSQPSLHNKTATPAKPTCFSSEKPSSAAGVDSATPSVSCDVNSSPRKHASDIPRLSSSCCSHRNVRTEKLLIFTMGEETYTPHLIGFKRIPLEDILGDKEAAQVKEEGEWGEEEVLLPNVEHNQQGIHRPPTSVDHSINLKGHIVGMALSPDHRYLYVNSRQWPENYHIEAPLEPPPIAQEIDIHVIDLVTLKEVGTVMRSHKAYTPNDECFFLFLDVSDHYVASGAEDKRGYLWDRHYGIHLQCFAHTDVVNSVAFNPRDQEMLITVSDDNIIKIWRSRRKMREMHQRKMSATRL